jgi:hypothetical protein
MMKNEEMLIIVDNTNTKIWELKPYVEMVNKNKGTKQIF